MKKITVFTPTFNRAYCLTNCYESLKRQTNKDFIWLIVDDGSTDNTKELVSYWQTESLIDIQYIWQENLGMHGAHNRAYELIETELNVCIDSDDYLTNDAVEKILGKWEREGSENVSGLIGLDSHPDGTVVGTRLPVNLKTSTLFDLYYKHGVTGDKKLVYRTELTKKFPYPVFENEKYVGLAYKYYKLDQEYEMLLMDEVLCCVEYLPDGSSLNMEKQYRKNPRGFAFYRKEMMKLPFASKKFKYQQAIHLVSSSLLSKDINFIKEAPNKFLTTLAVPIGVLLFLFIKIKTRQI
jgi:glycosyltransferase involved in cell wall biosynthesis